MRRTVFFIITLLVLLPLAQCAEVIQVTQQPSQTPPEKTSLWGSIKSVLTSPLFWGIILLLLFIAVLMVGLFFLIQWLIKYIKSEKDIFYKLKNDRFKIAKMHTSYVGCKHWWKIDKNKPVRLLREYNGKVQVSQPIAYYRGHYTTHEGNIFIAVHFEGRNKYFILPDNDVIIIPNYSSVTVQTQDKRNKSRTTETIDNLPKASDIISFNEEGIILKAEGVSRVGMFFVPVLKSQDGSIVDLSVPTYATMKKVFIDDLLYAQSSDFVHLTKKAVDMNVQLRATDKIQDPNKSTEVNTESGQ